MLLDLYRRHGKEKEFRQLAEEFHLHFNAQTPLWDHFAGNDDADAGLEAFPHVVVYTPPAPRTAICVEPNTCPTDAFNLASRGIDANVLVLKAGESARFDVHIERTPL